MVRNDKDLTSHFYETACQRLSRISHFMKQCQSPIGTSYFC